ncbi:MAG: DUF1772 domain-containing protein, partial [Cyclobacteriaceae bacterium]
IALITGLLFAFSIAINRALRFIADLEYIHTMQAINRAIINPAFLLCFIGTLPGFVITAWLWYRDFGFDSTLVVILLASTIYFFGVFGITVRFNVPLNNALANVNTHSLSVTEIKNTRKAYEQPWVKYHNLRMLASILCLACMLYSLLKHCL